MTTIEKIGTPTGSARKKVRVVDFPKMKADGQRIVMVTAYDYPTAMLADEAGVDSILVGDSYGMVVLGYDNTIPVTMEEMLPVARAVRRGAKRGPVHTTRRNGVCQDRRRSRDRANRPGDCERWNSRLGAHRGNPANS